MHLMHMKIRFHALQGNDNEKIQEMSETEATATMVQLQVQQKQKRIAVSNLWSFVNLITHLLKLISASSDIQYQCVAIKKIKEGVSVRLGERTKYKEDACRMQLGPESFLSEYFYHPTLQQLKLLVVT